jgi:tetratricopeptide (TPR) repeat protein
MLLLAADKAYNREYELLGQSGPGFARHEGAFSLMVNFHAIGQYALGAGGQYLHSSHHHPQLDVAGFVFGLPSAATVETRQAFEEEIAGFSPEDLFALREVVEAHTDTMSVEQILAWIRCTRWDAIAIRSLFVALSKQLDGASDALKRDVYEVVQRAWEDYYFIGERDDLITTLGMLLGQMEYYAEALTFLERAEQAYGPDAQIHYLMAMCHYRRAERDAALSRLEQALALDPVMDDARLLRIILETDLSQQPAAESPASLNGRAAFRIEALRPLRA